MEKVSKIHFTIILILNLVLVLKMISIAWEGNDKALLIIILGHLTLTILNSTVWLILKFLKLQEYFIYKVNTIGLLLLFIPAIIISSLYS